MKFSDLVKTDVLLIWWFLLILYWIIYIRLFSCS